MSTHGYIDRELLTRFLSMKLEWLAVKPSMSFYGSGSGNSALGQANASAKKSSPAEPVRAKVKSCRGGALGNHQTGEVSFMDANDVVADLHKQAPGKVRGAAEEPVLSPAWTKPPAQLPEEYDALLQRLKPRVANRPEGAPRLNNNKAEAEILGIRDNRADIDGESPCRFHPRAAHTGLGRPRRSCWRRNDSARLGATFLR